MGPKLEEKLGNFAGPLDMEGINSIIRRLIIFLSIRLIYLELIVQLKKYISRRQGCLVRGMHFICMGRFIERVFSQHLPRLFIYLVSHFHQNFRPFLYNLLKLKVIKSTIILLRNVVNYWYYVFFQFLWLWRNFKI